MNNIDSKRIAANGLLIILTLIILFHILVLVRIIPFHIVWGGRLKDVSQMVVFETLSIGINILMLAVVGVHGGLVKTNIHPRFIKIALWIMGSLFLINTLGNLVAISPLERLVFTPLTLLLSIGSFRLAVGTYPARQQHSRKTATKDDISH